MDLEKVFKLIADHAAQYLALTVDTLTSPFRSFKLASVDPDGSANPPLGSPLTSQLVIYGVLSIIIGISINSLIPDRKAAPDLLASTAFLLVHWVVYGSCLHLLCRLFRGGASYSATLALVIRLFGALYLVTSFMGVVAGILIRSPVGRELVRRVPQFGQGLVGQPVLAFFAIGLVLMFIYLPLMLRALHRLGWFPTIAIAIVPVVMLWFSVQLYFGTGVLDKSMIIAPQ